MNCNDARPLLDLLSDGALDAKDSALVLDHLRDCHECHSEWEGLEQLRASFLETKSKPDLPPDMMARISESLQAEDRNRGKNIFKATPFAMLVAASVLILGILLSPLVLQNPNVTVQSTLGNAHVLDNAQALDSAQALDRAHALDNAHALVLNAAVESTLDVVKDEQELSHKLGYDIKHVQLPDWSMYRSGLYRTDHPTAIARFDFVQKNQRDNHLTCYQAKQGTIQPGNAEIKHIGDRIVFFGTCDECRYALWSEHGRDYLFVSKMPMPSLETIVRGA